MRLHKIYFALLLSLIVTNLFAQSVPSPGKTQSQAIVLKNATLHIGDGTQIDKGSILFENGVITALGATIDIPSNAQVLDFSGKHIYPGLIAIDTKIGITEVEALRQTRDFEEAGTLNANVRTLIAYNTDSNVTPTVRSNGILIAQVAPDGGVISGTSSVMQLDAWNWEDAALKADDAIYLNWPRAYSRTGWWAQPGNIEPAKDYTSNLTELRDYFAQAQSYANQNVEFKNARFESMKDLFDGSKQLFIRVDGAQQIISAVKFAQDFNIKPVIVGGTQSVDVADFLVENNVPVVLNALHRTPSFEDEAIFRPYELPRLLHQKGVKFAITYADFWQVRNLPFQAGQAIAFGLSKEEAIKTITLNAAEILGIDDVTGSLALGKQANIIVSDGDVMDMMSNNIIDAYIQGRKVNLGNKQKDLYIKFSDKYDHEYDKP